MTHPLHIRILGPLQVSRDGDPLPETAWRSRQDRRLLGILLTARGSTVPNADLLRWLWPDADLDAAASTLRSAVSSLRRTLEPTSAARASSRYVLTRPGGYAWNTASGAWIDAEEFLEKTIDDRRWRMEAPLSSLSKLQDTVELYRGDYLEDEPDAPWAIRERERLRQRYLRALTILADLQIARGEHTAAMQLAEQGLARDPLHEPLYRALMLAQGHAGDTAGALRSYERCRHALTEALGAAPAPQTRDVHSAILRGTVDDTATGRQGGQEFNQHLFTRSPAHPLKSSPLVGRERELAQLRGWMAEWLHGRGGIVLVGGEAGIGKTRLLDEARRMALARNALLVTIRATALEQALPFSSLSEALRPLLRAAPDVLLARLPPTALAQVAELLPLLRERLPDLPMLPPVPPAERHNRLLDGLVDVALALSGEQPLIITCDDAQWADEATLLAFGRLARRAPRRALLLVLVYRVEEMSENPVLHTLLRSLGRDMLRPLLLTRFDRAEVAQFLADLAQVEPARTEQLAARLVARTGGNPLFLTVAVQALLEAQHAPSLAALLPQLREDAALPDLAGTPRMRDLVLGRLERLPEHARALLEHIAIIGRSVSLDLIEQLAGAAALDNAQLLLERSFLAENADGRLQFNHELVRAIVAASLSLPRRRQLHRQAAEAIAALYGNLPERAAELTAHFAQAGHGAELHILHYAVVAGDEARRAFGYHQALEHYDAALHAATRLDTDAPTDAQQRAFTGKLLTFEALLDWDGITETADQFDRWAAGCAEQPAPLLTPRRRVLLRALMGDLASAAAVGESGNNETNEQATPRLQHPALDDMLRRTALILQPTDTRSSAHPLTRSPYHPFTPAPPLPGAPADELPALLGPDAAALALFQVGWAALSQGLLRDAEPCLLRAYELGIATGQAAAAVVSALQLAHLHALRGDATALDQWLQRSLELAQQANEAAWAAIWPRIHQGFLWLLDDQFAEAQARFEQMDAQLAALPSFEAHRASVEVGLGLLALARNDHSTARRLLNEAAVSPHLHGFVYITAQHGLARLAALDGAVEQSRTILAHALAYSTERRLLPEYVRTVIEIARIERDFGDPRAALPLLEAAAELAEQAGVGALAAVARALLARLTA